MLSTVHNPLRAGLAPEARVALTTGFVVAAALVRPGAFTTLGLFVAAGAVAVAAVMVLARRGESANRANLVARLALIGPVLIMVCFVPLVSAGTSRTEALGAAATLAMRSITGILAATALSLSLRPEEIALGLGRLRVPTIMTTIALLMLRYFTLTIEDWGTTRQAMTSRGHDPRWFFQLRPMASAAGTLFLRTHRRGEQVHGAMMARGFTGTLPSPTVPAATPNQWLAVAAAIAVCLALAAGSHGVFQ